MATWPSPLSSSGQEACWRSGWRRHRTGAGTLAHSQPGHRFRGRSPIDSLTAGSGSPPRSTPTASIAPWSDLARRSAAVLACHEDRNYPGAMVASLSIPWGNKPIRSRRLPPRLGQGLRRGRHSARLASARRRNGGANPAVAVARPAARRPLDPERLSRRPAVLDPESSSTSRRCRSCSRRRRSSAERGRPGVTPMVLARRSSSSARQRPGQPAGSVGGERRHERLHHRNGDRGGAVVAAHAGSTPDDAAYATSLADYWNERIEDWLYDSAGGRALRGHRGHRRLLHATRAERPTEACGRIDVRNRADARRPRPTAGASTSWRSSGSAWRRARPAVHRPGGSSTSCDSRRAPDRPLPPATTATATANTRTASRSTAAASGAWPLLAGERGHWRSSSGETRYRTSIDGVHDRARRTATRAGVGRRRDPDALPTGPPDGPRHAAAWAHAEFLDYLARRSTGRPFGLLEVVAQRYDGDSRPPPRRTGGHALEAFAGGRDLLVEEQAAFVALLGSTVGGVRGARRRRSGSACAACAGRRSSPPRRPRLHADPRPH